MSYRILRLDSGGHAILQAMVLIELHSDMAGEVPSQPVRTGLPDMDREVGDATLAMGNARWRAFPP
jgi:hypothetical protein